MQFRRAQWLKCFLKTTEECVLEISGPFGTRKPTPRAKRSVIITKTWISVDCPKELLARLLSSWSMDYLSSEKAKCFCFVPCALSPPLKAQKGLTTPDPQIAINHGARGNFFRFHPREYQIGVFNKHYGYL